MSFIKLNIKTRVRFAAQLPHAGVPVLLSFIKRVFFMLFFLICILNAFFLNKINFGNLGNFVTVGDTFIS
jgi:hypothetical protein